MSQINNTGNRDRSDLEAYLGNRMSEEERNSFERRLEADPFLREALEGLSSISPGDLLDDMKRLESSIENRTRRRVLPVWYRIGAAAVILLVVSSLLLVRQLSDNSKIATAGDENPPVIRQDELVTTPEQPVIEAGKSREVVRSEPESMELVDHSPDDARAAEEIVEETGIREKSTTPLARVESDIVLKVADQEQLAVAGTVADKSDTSKQVDELVADIIPGMEVKRAAGKAVAAPEKEITVKGSNIVRGTILSSDDSLPLPGTMVAVKGESRAVVTDYNGNFEIMADSSQTLVASFVGMKSREIEVRSDNLGNISLDPDMLSLDEVVVVGYGVAGRAAGVTTGAVATIEPDPESPLFVPAEPEGGMPEFRDYIKLNQLFPADYTESDRVVVRIRFRISPGKEPSDFEIIKSPGESFSNEAIRLISNGPAWNPATRDGVAVSENVNLRIVFRRR